MSSSAQTLNVFFDKKNKNVSVVNFQMGLVISLSYRVVDFALGKEKA